MFFIGAQSMWYHPPQKEQWWRTLTILHMAMCERNWQFVRAREKHFALELQPGTHGVGVGADNPPVFCRKQKFKSKTRSGGKTQKITKGGRGKINRPLHTRISCAEA